jgi:transcriptional regulator with XRE-family HTH domain
MNIIKNWKEESRYTYSFIGELLGVTTAKVQRYENGQEIEPEVLKHLKDVYRLDRLIAQEPSDILLLKYELSQLTGFSIDELDGVKKKAKEKIERKADIVASEEPVNLRKVALGTLEKMRDNGYRSVYRPNVTYDANAVDAEICRKKFNIKRKREIWEEKLALNA